ncbi:protein SODIUM POTASSIUM ROOT DEFECTIVE 3-like [Oryza glaberrima]|nr:protein SODIUM POTASSIUM ROOT DEFECTIVE 3-like [Oryza glaberrima]
MMRAMRRRRLRIGKVLDCFSFSMCCARSSGCLCLRASEEDGDEEAAMERKSLVSSSSQVDQVIRLRDLVDGTRTLGFHLEPKTVELKVSMHCNGCAKKVQKHISRMEGVTWFEVDLEKKKVVVTGDVTPLEVLQSISKVKFAQLWPLPPQPAAPAIVSSA